MNLNVPEATRIKTAILVHQSLNPRTIFSEIIYVNFIKKVGNQKWFLKGYSPCSYYRLNHYDTVRLFFYMCPPQIIINKKWNSSAKTYSFLRVEKFKF